MKKKNVFLLAAILIAALGTWAGRTAWRVHQQLVTLDVHNAPLAEVLRKIENQTWKKIRAERALDARITLHVKDKPLAEVLDRISEQAGARWSTVYAVYGSADSLSQLNAALQGDGQLKPVGWSKVVPQPAPESAPGFEPDSPSLLPPPNSEEPGPGGEKRVTMMFRRTPDGQVSIQAGNKTMSEIWSPEELVMESSLEGRLGPEVPTKATSEVAAEMARRLHAQWTSCLALRKSILGIGLGGPGPRGKPGDPLKHNPNDRFARLTPQQRVQQARQRNADPMIEDREIEFKR